VRKRKFRFLARKTLHFTANHFIGSCRINSEWFINEYYLTAKRACHHFSPELSQTETSRSDQSAKKTFSFSPTGHTPHLINLSKPSENRNLAAIVELSSKLTLELCTWFKNIPCLIMSRRNICTTPHERSDPMLKLLLTRMVLLTSAAVAFSSCSKPLSDDSVATAASSSQGTAPTTPGQDAVPRPVAAPLAAKTIMAMGDSNTYGAVAQSYRQTLADLMSANGLAIEFVGSQVDNRTPGFSNNHHEGYSGWAADDLLNGMNGLLPMKSVEGLKPDVILLMAGTNEFLVKKYTVAQAEAHMAALIAEIHRRSPKSKLIVSTIFPFVDTGASPRKTLDVINHSAVSFNQWLIAAAQNFAAQGVPISSIDIYDFIDLNWLTDGVHASGVGYQAVGQAWYSALAPYVASARKLPAPPCVASSGSRAYIMTSLRYFSSVPLAYPALTSQAATLTSNINGGIATLLKTNWACQDTTNVSQYVQASVSFIKAASGQ
jgi:lysophospholipase L1-like esterase